MDCSPYAPPLRGSLPPDGAVSPWGGPAAKRHPRGFTLIELLITVAILAMLAGGAMTFADLAAKRTHEQELRGALRQIREAIEARGAELRYLPPYSPDLNPIENAFSKLKALLRKAAARSIEQLWDAIARIIQTYSPHECANYFAAAGYDAD